MVRKVLILWVHWAHEKSESWEPEGNVPPLCDRFAKGERQKMLTLWDSARMHGVANVLSYQVTKDSPRPSHSKGCKIDNASVLNRNM